MVFSDLVVVHNGGLLLQTHLALAMQENDGADRLALGQNLLRGFFVLIMIAQLAKDRRAGPSISIIIHPEMIFFSEGPAPPNLPDFSRGHPSSSPAFTCTFQVGC